ncbi:MAG: hypothetical protein ACYC2O_03680 [Microthrixaceae bacterium]
MLHCRVPNDETVGGMLTDLLGREVKCVWTPGTHELPRKGQIAIYSDDDEVAVAVAIADAGFICRTGGALVMVPSGGVNEAAESGEIPESLHENFAEVVNIMASLLNSDETPHVRLTAVVARDEIDAHPAAVEIMDSPTKRRVFDINVDAYGRGRIVMLFP